MPRSILFTVFAFLFSCIALAQERAELSFEILDAKTGLPQGWAAGIGKGTSGIQPGMRMRTDSVVRRRGHYALSVACDSANDFVSVVHIINRRLDAGRIKLTGFLKTENVKGWAGLWMRIDGKTRGLEFDNMQGRPVSGTTDWKEYEIELPYDKEEAVRINVGALLVGSGKIWIDNFHITLDGKDIMDAATFTTPLLPADADTSNYHGSGIQSIALTPEKITRLAKLGALWGFIKYYHAGVQEGNHNMDASLLRVLPLILAAKDGDEAAVFMEKWVETFGTTAPCAACKDIAQIKDVALKPDYSVLFKKGSFPPSLIAKLEYIRSNRYIANRKHYYVDMYPEVGNPAFRNEYAYSDQPYPDAGVRLLALFRYWNMIQYFFPDKHLISEDWNEVLPEFIPLFCKAKDTTEYQLACLKLIARIHDTHAGLREGATKLQDVKGALITPFQARFVEGKLVVTGFYKDAPGLSEKVAPGDVIESIDGMPVADLVKKYLPLTPASNYETQLHHMASLNGFLLRGNKEDAALRVSRNGKTQDITIQRIPVDRKMYAREDASFRPDKGYKLLAENTGYLYPALLSDASLDSVRTLFHHTKGLVIDLRCYPGTFMPFAYGAWLKPKATAFVRFTGGSTDMPGLFTKTDLLKNGADNKDYYLGKVVIIVNELTISQAEYTTMALQTIPGAITIGGTTAGADGNVSEIILPGGLHTMISGLGVLYPDGTETQRKGVRIDRIVKPTIKGIQDGKDELLEAALRLARGG